MKWIQVALAAVPLLLAPAAVAVPIAMVPGSVSTPFGAGGVSRVDFVAGDFDGARTQLEVSIGIEVPTGLESANTAFAFDVPVLSACAQGLPPRCPDAQSGTFQAFPDGPMGVQVLDATAPSFPFFVPLLIELDGLPDRASINATSVRFSTAPAVPEPSAWLLFPLGLVLVSRALRAPR